MEGEKNTRAVTNRSDAFVGDVLRANGGNTLSFLVENDGTVDSNTTAKESCIDCIIDGSTFRNILMHRWYIKCDFDALERKSVALYGDGYTDIFGFIGDGIDPSLCIVGCCD